MNNLNCFVAKKTYESPALAHEAYDRDTPAMRSEENTRLEIGDSRCSPSLNFSLVCLEFPLAIVFCGAFLVRAALVNQSPLNYLIKTLSFELAPWRGALFKLVPFNLEIFI